MQYLKHSQPRPTVNRFTSDTTDSDDEVNTTDFDDEMNTTDFDDEMNTTDYDDESSCDSDNLQLEASAEELSREPMQTEFPPSQKEQPPPSSSNLCTEPTLHVHPMRTQPTLDL